MIQQCCQTQFEPNALIFSDNINSPGTMLPNTGISFSLWDGYNVKSRCNCRIHSLITSVTLLIGDASLSMSFSCLPLFSIKRISSFNTDIPIESMVDFNLW